MFEEDKAAARALAATQGKRVLGIECPVRNGTGEVCKECERVKAGWRAGDAENEKWSRDHQAKESYFLNIIDRNGDAKALKIGKKVAKALKQKLERYKERTGKMFGFANLEEGEWVAISKTGDHPNFEYDFEMLGEKAEPVEVDLVKGMPSLNNLTADYTEGLIDIHDVSTLASGDSYEFRMLPIPTSDKKATEMIFRYYHWRCSEAEIISGDVGTSVATGTATPEEFTEYMTAATGDGAVQGVSSGYTLQDPPGCFGHFVEGDDDCMENDCDDIREACKMEKTASKKPKK
jgi:hypothetical protein